MEINTTEEQFLKIRELAENAADLYDKKIYSILEKENKKLHEKLTIWVDKYATEYNLVLANDSCKDIKLYELSSRVKKKESLKEKIIRDQIFYDLNNTKSEAQMKKVIISKFDDLIGLRFLVSLTNDCESLYNLFKDHSKELEGEKISFSNLDYNPQNMHNGRSIYRLKGNFNKYRFELQIKSKVDSAWADIEHMLFYKDFNFSYVQGTNRAVMNKIGDLLEQVDGLMLEVRNSQDGYDDKVQELEFNQYLRKRYVNLVREKLGSSYILTEYKDILYSLFERNSCFERKGIISLKEIPKEKQILEFEYEELTTKTLFYKNYCKLKVHSIELMVFESIYYEWISYIDGEYNQINTKKLVEFITDLVSRLGEDFNESVDENSRRNFSEWLSESFIKIMEENDLKCTNRVWFFNKKLLSMIFSFWEARGEAYLNIDVLNDEYIEIDIEKINQVILRYLLNMENEKYYINEINDIVNNSESDNCRDVIFSTLIKNINERYNVNHKNPIDKSVKNKEENKIEILLINSAKVSP